MFNKVSKKIFILALVFLAFIATSLFAASMVAKAEEGVDKDAVSAQLTPRRETEYGNEGKLHIVGNTVYKNYDNGCVAATLGTDNKIMSKRDFGGVNYNPSTEKLEILKSGDDYKLKDMILSRGTDENVRSTWNNLAIRFNSEVSYNPRYALEKIYEAYADLCDEGYNCGIATDNLSVWDNVVIKLDFYDGDCEYGFGEEGGRVHVTTIAYSFTADKAFAIKGKIFDFYQNAKASSLSEPVTDTFPYTDNGVDGEVQAFAFGYIFLPDNSNKLTVRSGVQWNEVKKKFEVIKLDKEDFLTEITDAALKDSPYYSEFTVAQIKDLFYNKYSELVAAGFNPGVPDHEGIYYWDTEYMKQAYVGSDGTGNAWGRTNLMLMLNPYDGKVYAVYGEILNIVDKASHGLGNARSLGFPVCDATTVKVNGLNYTYQDFYRPFYSDESTIYNIEGNSQLTRHIVGGYFNDVVAGDKKVSANNPKYYYVVEPWLISLICIIPVVLAGAGAAVYFFVIKKRKKNAIAGTAETTETAEAEGGNE